MSLVGQSAQGQGDVLVFTVRHWVKALNVTCTATNVATNVVATATKQLQVLAGPANVSITGTDLVAASTSYTYSCHAYCQPSCTYAWKLDGGAWFGGQGNTISMTPWETYNPISLTCKATNSVSGMFVSATQKINVTSGPSEVQIKGPDTVGIAETHRFTCTAECLPSCRYLSSVDNQTVRGNVVEMRVDHPLKSVSLKCEAQNTASGKTATAFKTIKIRGPDSNASPRLEETSTTLLLAFMIYAVLKQVLWMDL
ncbi:uncharacterized protein LOC113164776 [Anabas testudineus]|uniref:uncharacterized protein LOC113164776 n=1 Tax=Anabas testudineus TaxID=64144 RepID=UPI000E453FD8|nr:uncharacterized protein LOC113164776 [Anabas testudineus]